MSKFAVGALSYCMMINPLANAAKAEEDSQADDRSTFADREDIGIYLNKHVENLTDVMDASDKLSLLYIFNSDISHDAHGQDWRILSSMFIKVLDELKGGYVNTYAIDCAVKHETVDPKINLDAICGVENWQPVFHLFKPPEVRVNPYTGKTMPI